jgi:hypothetical protein
MNSILYYSNHCNHSKDILFILSRMEVKKDMHFVCIDNRVKEKNGKINVILDNGAKILLPPNVMKVPALLLLNRGNRVLFGEEIKEFIRPKKKSVESMIMGGEPLAFSFSNENEIISDKFSFLDTPAEDLMAKGCGGLRMLHNYATLDGGVSIETPPETGMVKKPTLDINKIQKERNVNIGIKKT